MPNGIIDSDEKKRVNSKIKRNDVYLYKEKYEEKNM